MYYISKRFNFEAAHHLEGLPAEHLCSRDHGHSYVVILHLRGETLNKIGFVVDYRKLDSFKKFIDESFDHRDLNKVLAFNPTAENLAEYFYHVAILDFSKLYAVTVKETEKTEARYQPKP